MDDLDRTDRAVLEPSDGFSHEIVIAPAEAGDDRQVLLPGERAGVDDGADAGAVGGDGLFDEAMLAGLDGGLEVQRAEAGRGGEQDDVNALDDLLVGVEPGKAVVVGDVEARAPLAAQVGAAGFEVVGEHVAEGDEPHVLAGVHRVDRRARAPAAAAHEADFDRVGTGRVRAGARDAGRQGRAQQRRRPQEVAARAAVRLRLGTDHRSGHVLISRWILVRPPRDESRASAMRSIVPFGPSIGQQFFEPAAPPADVDGDHRLPN